MIWKNELNFYFFKLWLLSNFKAINWEDKKAGGKCFWVPTWLYQAAQDENSSVVKLKAFSNSKQTLHAAGFFVWHMISWKQKLDSLTSREALLPLAPALREKTASSDRWRLKKMSGNQCFTFSLVSVPSVHMRAASLTRRTTTLTFRVPVVSSCRETAPPTGLKLAS